MSSLTVLMPSDAEVADLYPEENEPRGLGEIPAGIQARIDELAQLIDRDTTITLTRDWEDCAFGMLDNDGDPRFDVLAFTDDGRVGHGGVNQPDLLQQHQRPLRRRRD